MVAKARPWSSLPSTAAATQTLGVREGYREWAETYEDVVQDEMDLRLLARLESVDWAAAARVLELACGTGRIGAWLRARGVPRIDGLDFTPEMLALAAAKGVYDRLFQADMLDTGLRADRRRSGARGSGGRTPRGAAAALSGSGEGSRRRPAPSSSSAITRIS